MKFDDDEFHDETTIKVMGFNINTSIDWDENSYKEKKKKILKGNINIIKGKLSEYIAYIHLVSESYNVESYSNIVYYIENNDRNNELIKRHKEYHDKLISGEYDMKNWNRWLERDIYYKEHGKKYSELIQRFSEKFILCVKNLHDAYNTYGMKNHCPRYIPDFVALKGKNMFVIEVKSYTKRESRLPKHQKESLELSKDLGFQPIIVKIPIRAELTITEGLPSLQFL